MKVNKMSIKQIQSENTTQKHNIQTKLNQAFKQAYNKTKQSYCNKQKQQQFKKLKRLQNVQLQNIVDQLTDFNFNDDFNNDDIFNEYRVTYTQAGTDMRDFNIDIDDYFTQYDMNQKVKYGLVRHQSTQIDKKVERKIVVHNISTQSNNMQIKRNNLKLSSAYNLQCLLNSKPEDQTVKKMKMLINNQKEKKVEEQHNQNINNPSSKKQTPTHKKSAKPQTQKRTPSNKSNMNLIDQDLLKSNHIHHNPLLYTRSLTQKHIKMNDQQNNYNNFMNSKNKKSFIEQIVSRKRRLETQQSNGYKNVKSKLSKYFHSNRNSKDNNNDIKSVKFNDNIQKQNIDQNNNNNNSYNNDNNNQSPKQRRNGAFYSQHQSRQNKSKQSLFYLQNKFITLSTPKWKKQLINNNKKSNHIGGTIKTNEVKHNIMCQQEIQFMRNPLKSVMMNYLATKIVKRPKLVNNMVTVINNKYNKQNIYNRHNRTSRYQIFQPQLCLLHNPQLTTFLPQFSQSLTPFIQQLHLNLSKLQPNSKPILTSLREKNLSRIISSCFQQSFLMLNKIKQFIV